MQTTGVAALDPRARIVAVVAFAVVVAAATQWLVLVGALALAGLACVAAGVSRRRVLRRLLALEGLMLIVLLTLPFSVPGEPVLVAGPFVASAEGLARAASIVAKANAVLLMLLALLDSVPAVTLGHALRHLRLPDRLVQLLFFTVRYLDLIGDEAARLRRAMTARAFRPRTDAHTRRSLGHLAGALLVRSFERAERVLAAMKCRGFDGRFPMLDHFVWRAADSVFVAAVALVLAGLLGAEIACASR